MRVSTRNRTFKQWQREISSLPKNLTLFKASRRLRVCYPYASVKLKQHGYKVLETRGGFHGTPKLSKAVIRRINWKLPNATIAENLKRKKRKVSREWIRRIRQEQGQPKVNGRKA